MYCTELWGYALTTSHWDARNTGTHYRVPTAQGIQGKGEKKSLSVKTHQIWTFCQNTGKKQGI